MSSVSIAEGKKSFSRLIHDAVDKKEEIVVTRRGKPVAVISSYEEYQTSRRMAGFIKIMEARQEYLKSGISADEIYKESKRQLEKRR